MVIPYLLCTDDLHSYNRLTDYPHAVIISELERGYLRNGDQRMLKTRHLVLGLALWFALIGYSWGQSQQSSPSELESSQPQQPKAQTAKQQAAPDQQNARQDAPVIETPPTQKTNGEAAHEVKDGDEKTTNDRKLIQYSLDLDILTAIIAAIGALQLFVFGYQAWKLRQTVDSSEKAIATTREIGEAQVRAYVKIKSASIYFLGEDAMPAVEIVAANSGQSPALNFVWVPEIHYLPEKAPEIVSDVVEGWNLEPGIDIHSASEHKTLYFLHDFSLVEKITTDGSTPSTMGVSVILYYAWEDVFGKTSVDFASFASVAEIGSAEENQRHLHPLNTSQWGCKLNPIAKGQSWSGIAVKVPEINKKEKTDPHQ